MSEEKTQDNTCPHCGQPIKTERGALGHITPGTPQRFIISTDYGDEIIIPRKPEPKAPEFLKDFETKEIDDANR